MKIDVDSWLTRGGQEDTEATLARVRAIEALNKRRRRFIIYFLKQHSDDAVELWDLAAQIAAWEEESNRDAVTYDQQKTVHSSLYQYHAPRLADAGLIEYHQTQGTVRLTDRGRAVNIYHQQPRVRVTRWALSFLSISTLGAFVVAADAVVMRMSLRVPLAVGKIIVIIGLLLTSVAFVRRAKTVSTEQPTGPPPEYSVTDTQTRSDRD